MRPEEIAVLSPIMPIRDILSREQTGQESLAQYAGLFSESLMGSLNLFPVFQSTDVDHDRPFTPFGVYQGLADYLLVVVGSTHQVQLATLLTRDEALSQIGEWLVEDVQLAGSQSRMVSRKAFIHQFGNGVIRTTGNLSEEQAAEIEATAEFQTLLMQAKYLSGRIYYTEPERRVLTDWVERTGRRADLLELFETKILRFKENSARVFRDSPLYEVLIERAATPEEEPEE
jgi:hypothetical protein